MRVRRRKSKTWPSARLPIKDLYGTSDDQREAMVREDLPLGLFPGGDPAALGGLFHGRDLGHFPGLQSADGGIYQDVSAAGLGAAAAAAAEHTDGAGHDPCGHHADGGAYRAHGGAGFQRADDGHHALDDAD